MCMEVIDERLTNVRAKSCARRKSIGNFFIRIGNTHRIFGNTGNHKRRKILDKMYILLYNILIGKHQHFLLEGKKNMKKYKYKDTRKTILSRDGKKKGIITIYKQ